MEKMKHDHRINASAHGKQHSGRPVAELILGNAGEKSFLHKSKISFIYFCNDSNAMVWKLPVFFLLIFTLALPTQAQRRVKLKEADSLVGGIKDGERFDRVLGNVVFVQNNTTIYCDSAHFFKSQNKIDAFGKVHIVDGDSVDVTSALLTYDGNNRVAHLRRKVVFTKLGLATLYTDYLDYDRTKNKAKYFNGGELVDTTNTLTSRKGYYDVNTNMASFKTQVVGVNKDYTMTSDTLQYNSKTKIIYFRDSTTIKDKEGGVAVYQNGFYNTHDKISSLSSGEIETPSNKLQGNKYFLDDLKRLYKTQGDVVMTSKEENLIVYGDDGIYDKQRGITKVFGHAYLAKISDDNDTLFMSADTLVSIENEDPARKRLLAYNNVKIFKSDMQGTADSVAYISADSMLYFYKDPVLWTEENQMTADSIHMLIKKKSIDRIYLVSNSFVISEDTLTNFNQIKGRKMTAFFDDKAIKHVLVEGNGESIYYALEEKKVVRDADSVKVTAMMGMNKIICSNMKINFREGKVSNISFYIRPDASFIPPHELKEGDRKLKGFTWREEEKPTRNEVIQLEVKNPN
jgi:lipopolysaccharide export system protein LptA